MKLPLLYRLVLLSDVFMEHRGWWTLRLRLRETRVWRDAVSALFSESRSTR